MRVKLSLDFLTTHVIRANNQKGHLIKRISLGKKETGMYVKKDDAAYWDGRNEKGERVAGGIYFYTITAGQFKDTKKMVILK